MIGYVILMLDATGLVPQSLIAYLGFIVKFYMAIGLNILAK